MFYINTRNNYHPVKGSEAICLGMVPGGGLFVPEEIPFYFPDQEQLAAKDYLQLAEDIVGLYLDDFNKEEIRSMINGAYCRGNFDDGIAPLVQVGNKHILELWHGPTAAFKDMALQLLPRLLTASIAKNNKQMETVILVATSGDTGKAALEGFKNVDGIKIIVFYPAEGVSYIQERQMLVTDGDNTYVVAVEGNFDDCQSAVKAIFADPQLNQALAEHNKCFSSANSINWGRLLPQIVYYYDGYRQMMAQNEIKWGQKINIVVPTGNFGNILAAYYAKKMGLPINKLICASNKNNVLTDAINKGIYDRRRPFYKTTSPSMDIL
ncbi:MAG: threonine synthase, partial [Clostridiales bacterium]